MKNSLALLSFALLSFSFGQTISLPFASKGNIFELSIKNGSAQVLGAVNVDIKESPPWITFEQRRQSIGSMTEGSEVPAVFAFSVGKEAPVGKGERVVFLVSIPQGESWKKELTVSVAPPKKFELFQNYPNPFNSRTAISFQLSVGSRVQLNVYNLIGQNVGTVLIGEKPAGYHQEAWDASLLSSGTYVYELMATDAENRLSISRKRMTVVK